MDLEETDDPFQNFKRVTLELNPDEVKITSPVKEIPIGREEKRKNSWENHFIAPIASIPQRITETFKNMKSDEGQSTSLRPAAEFLTGGEAKDFFTFREGVVSRAVDECVEQFLDSVEDGPLQFYYLLTEISLWDTDKERLILVTSKSIVVVKYDFIAMKRLEYKKLSLECVDTVIIGDLIYPPSSIVPSRNMRGIRLMWNHGKPVNFITKWNPLNNDPQFTTFTTHPLYFHKDCTNDEQKRLYDVEEFIESLCSVVSKLNCNDNQPPCIIHHKNIVLENYVGIGSLIHNRNALGFFKVRGRFSF